MSGRRWSRQDYIAIGMPCICGEYPEDHDLVDAVGSVLTDCPGEYEPDVERLCQNCAGSGGYVYGNGLEQECHDCDGRGWLR